jgi:4-hydroxybutyrate CoA-transferase
VATDRRSRSPRQAVAALPAAARVVLASGCGTPLALARALAAPDAPPVHLYGGLLLGEYPFLSRVRDPADPFSYTTWHATRAVEQDIATGMVRFVPLRATAVPDYLRTERVTVALIRTTPPDRDGRCSLGPCGNYVASVIRWADVLIAEIDDTFPVTCGSNAIDADRISAWCEADQPAAEYVGATPNQVSEAIADRLMALLPDEPTLQIGIGAVPSALLARLAAGSAGTFSFVGMAVDAMVDMAEAGLLSARAPDGVGIMTPEALGSRRLLDYAHRNPQLAVHPVEVSMDVRELASRPRLVSVNSALQVDLYGQAAAETVSGRQIAGIGGSLEFAEAARLSEGGLRILALPATAHGGSLSRITTALRTEVVSAGRTAADFVVTEFGTADLRYADRDERRERLIEIAHPDHRDGLRAAPPPWAGARLTAVTGSAARLRSAAGPGS